tara:strand:- start:2030 stop:2905 length:876 start_codon:yes stop_codon:yes gene_type:complete
MSGKRSRGPWTLESMEIAARQSVDAAMDLGRRYREGDGVEQSDKEALRCFLQAVALRDAPPPAPPLAAATAKPGGSERRDHHTPAAPAPRDFNDVNKDVACLVFAHLRRYRDRVALSRVSKVWRDASKEAASLPDRLELGNHWYIGRRNDRFYNWVTMCTLLGRMIEYLMQHNGVLTLPKQRVHDLLVSVFLNDDEAYFCDDAACFGEFELMKWLRQHDYPWSEHTCKDVAYGGHLHVLKWARENGASWDIRTCQYAAQNKHWHILRYAIDNGCPGAERYYSWYYSVLPPA